MKGFKHWQWHLDEMYVNIGGEIHYLWRAVDQEGEVLESYVTRTRDKKATLGFIKKALKRHGSVETITTDGLRSAIATNSGSAAGPKTGWRTAIYPSGDESGRYYGSGR